MPALCKHGHAGPDVHVHLAVQVRQEEFACGAQGGRHERVANGRVCGSEKAIRVQPDAAGREAVRAVRAWIEAAQG